MIYLLAILLLILFWLIWVFLPDRRERWRYGYDDSASASDYASSDGRVGETASAGDESGLPQTYAPPVTPGVAYTTEVAGSDNVSTDVAPGATRPVSQPSTLATPQTLMSETVSEQSSAPVEPSVTASVPPISAESAGADDLTRIKGIGKVLEAKLHDLGVNSFLQIAQFTPQDIARVDEVLNFKGRIEREKWVEQAKELVAET